MSEADMVERLLSGCNDEQYSYDAYINGRYNGAFTRTAIDNFRLGDSYRQWYARIRTVLPSERYAQTPQLEGKETMKDEPAFGGNNTTEVPPDPPPPSPSSTNRMRWYHWAIIAGAVLAFILWQLLR